MSKHKFIGPAFYESTVNADCYFQLILITIIQGINKRRKNVQALLAGCNFQIRFPDLNWCNYCP